ncbi:MAG: GspE/PulE family protein [Pirellulaceae bacterium]|nr:type II/IV secretion system protein [Planctomycetales bacterium]
MEMLNSERHLRPHLAQNFLSAIDATGGIITVDNTEACAVALVRDAILGNASDIHFLPCDDVIHIRLRIDGRLLDAVRMPTHQAIRIVRHFKTLSDLDPMPAMTPLVARRSIDVDGRTIDIRVATVPSIGGEKMVLRLLNRRQLQHRVHELGMHDEELDEIRRWLRHVTGMFVVTGPTGSGKTTTLYALLQELRLHERSVVTIENPVEYRVDGITQIQVDEHHQLTFSEGVRATLRLDVDYILLGEVRDAASAHAAMEASSTGRTLMTTMHARDAVGAVTALRNWGLSDHEIATAMEVVIAQRLVRKLCTNCRIHESPRDDEAEWLHSLKIPVPEVTWHAGACDDCRGLGYLGRTGIFEVWRVSAEDYHAIVEHCDERSLREQLARRGHRALLTNGMTVATDGTTSLDELRQLGAFFVPPIGDQT